MDLDAGGAEILVPALARDRHRLEPDDIPRPAGGVDLAGGDHRGDAAVEARIDPVELALARRVVADHRMDMAVDEAGAERHAHGIDHRRRAVGVEVLGVAHRDDPVARADDAVAVDQRLLDAAREDLADIADDELGLAGGGRGGVGHDAPFPWTWNCRDGPTTLVCLQMF